MKSTISCNGSCARMDVEMATAAGRTEYKWQTFHAAADKGWTQKRVGTA